MTLNEIKKYFGDTGYAFAKATNMHHASYRNWEQKGFIPIMTQIKLERLTDGKLKASFEDLE